jgi:hypothetical protein
MTERIDSRERRLLLETLEARFATNKGRHEGIEWARVLARLQTHPDRLRTLHAMEQTGGEPDVIGVANGGEGFVFVDCSAQSPQGRRSLCYDREALDARKENKPRGNAIDMAAGMGIALLTEAQYRDLQRLGEFDTRTSSWIETPSAIRGLGGALFGDRRYDAVFVYHNGAESYYAARGFRGRLVV